MTRSPKARDIESTSLSCGLLMEAFDVELINLGSPAPEKSSNSQRSLAVAKGAAAGFRSTVILGSPEGPIDLQSTNVRRLVADRRYFGLEAQDFRAGAERLLARVSAVSPERARIDVRSLGEDFRLDAPATSALQRELLIGGLLHPDGAGGYVPTRLLRQYALACVVAPLSRPRAKALIERACALAGEINAAWTLNLFQIRMLAVSGSYMSQREKLSELSLSLVLRWRHEAPQPGAASPPGKDEAIRQIVGALSALSSFMVVRVVSGSEAVQRPFSVAFQHSKDSVRATAPPKGRLQAWSEALTRRLASR